MNKAQRIAVVLVVLAASGAMGAAAQGASRGSSPATTGGQLVEIDGARFDQSVVVEPRDLHRAVGSTGLTLKVGMKAGSPAARWFDGASRSHRTFHRLVLRVGGETFQFADGAVRFVQQTVNSADGTTQHYFTVEIREGRVALHEGTGGTLKAPSADHHVPSKGPGTGGPDQGILAKPLPDLEITKVGPAPGVPKVLKVDCHNLGPGASAPTQVKLYAYTPGGTVLTAQVPVPALAAGGHAVVQIGVGGVIVDAKLRVDDPNVVAEANELNNEVPYKPAGK